MSEIESFQSEKETFHSRLQRNHRSLHSTLRSLSVGFSSVQLLGAFAHASSRRIAGRIIPTTVLLIFLVYSHMLVFYSLDKNKGCLGHEEFYQSFLGFCHLVLWGGIPPLVVVVFSFLTIRNIRQANRRLRPQINIQFQPQQQQQQQQKHTRSNGSSDACSVPCIQSDD